jgi:hypothetical protein
LLLDACIFLLDKNEAYALKKKIGVSCLGRIIVFTVCWHVL